MKGPARRHGSDPLRLHRSRPNAFKIETPGGHFNALPVAAWLHTRAAAISPDAGWRRIHAGKRNDGRCPIIRIVLQQA